MAWPGYFEYGGTEIINANRTEAYAKAARALWFKPAYGNTDLGLMLGDTYASPRQDDAPWTDPDNPDTYDFWGVYPLEVTGIDDSTVTAPVTESTTDGGVVGRSRASTRSVVFSLALLGGSDAAVEAGMRWLTSAIANTLCGSQAVQNCQGLPLCFLASEPCLDQSMCPVEVVKEATDGGTIVDPSFTTWDDEVTADSPLLWWKFAEGSGTTAADSSGHANVGTYHGTPGFGAPGLLSSQSSAGVTFSGDDWVRELNGTAEAVLSTQQWTVETVIKTTQVTTGFIYLRFSASGFSRWGVTINETSGKLTAHQYGRGLTATGTRTVNDGQRHHVMIRQDATTFSLWVDGVKDAEVASNETPIGSIGDNQFLWFGADNVDTTRYIGDADDFVVYGTALNNARIAAHYGKVTTTPPTITLPGEPQVTRQVIPEDCIDSYLRSLHNVAPISGPTVTGKRTMTDGGEAWLVTLTMTAGNPYQFSAEQPIVAGFMQLDNPYLVTTPDGDVPFFDPDGVTTDEISCPGVTFQPITDPLCPQIVLPPRVPVVPLTCFDFPERYVRRRFSVPDQFIPSWGGTVPYIEVHTHQKEARNLRLRFYPDVRGTGHPDDDPCGYCGDIVVSYVPPGMTLVIDGTDQVVYLLDGNRRQRADSLVFGTDGGPFEWPLLSGGSTWIVTVDTPKSPADPGVGLDLSVYARAA